MKKMIFILSLLVLSTSALAKDGSSGCGPGWYFFKENSLVSSSLRNTTNAVLLPSVTFGMTSGTSNCTKHKLVQTEQESLKYASENYYELISEIALGEGEFLSQYADVIGCTPESKKSFKREMRKSFNKLFKTHRTNAEDLLKETYQVIFNNNQLLYGCSLG